MKLQLNGENLFEAIESAESEFNCSFKIGAQRVDFALTGENFPILAESFELNEFGRVAYSIFFNSKINKFFVCN